MFTIALPKGALLKDSISTFKRAGLDFSEALDENNRSLTFESNCKRAKALLVRNGDVPVYVSYGQPEDEHLVNDVLYSDYDFVQEYPNNFAMWFKTNSYPNESSYELSDNFGNIIFSKSGMQANTLYKDTFNLSPGCYKLQILDTGGNQNTNEDGLSWWANDDGSGYARLRAVPGGFFKYYQDDFGTELTDYFRVGEYSISMLENLKEPLYRIYPNPSKNQLNVEFNSPEITDYNFSIYDLNGKKIFSSDNNTARVNNFYVNLEFMENGLYNCVVKTNESVYSKSLVIIK